MERDMKEMAVNLFKERYATYEISKITGLSDAEIWEAIKELDPVYYSALKIFEHEKAIFSGFEKLSSEEDTDTKHR